ncbi:DUF3307 domain-containing protein [Rhizobium leguminosarum]
MFEQVLMLALMLIGAHWLCDYPLQGQFLSDAKAKGPLRFYHLVAHAGIQGAAVAAVTANVWLGLAEWVAHTVIDELKVRGRTTFAQDQALHIVCKALWLTVMFGLLSTHALAKQEQAKPERPLPTAERQIPVAPKCRPPIRINFWVMDGNGKLKLVGSRLLEGLCEDEIHG